ncbi:Membrane-bound lytic murein transglycosylase C [Serratia symbiotica]|nr:Membrane-bound lytic murein transglycosylase C [Serratia symbiotica]
MRKILFLFIMILFLSTCSNKNNNTNNLSYIKDTNGFNILMNQFAYNIENIWGINEILIAGPRDYVKYTDQYKTRSHINFDFGLITIETIMHVNPIKYLRKTIINTLLMGDNFDILDLYSDINNISINQEPFLYGQLLDHKGFPIRWEWQAARYADELLQNKIKKRISGLNVIYTLNIQLLKNHLDKRAHKYLPIVHQASKKYGVKSSLILAIMQIESSFNPYAVSSSDALGLMQVMQHTAGKDVFHTQGKWGKPSRSYLFNPNNNIDIGTAYLALLQNNYLRGIQNPISHSYAVITAYNSGAGSVLRVFSHKRNHAVRVINSLQPEEVYKILITKHPITESRRYLVKVNQIQKSYHQIT